MKDMRKREIEYIFSSSTADTSKVIRLERALEKAYEWQNTLVGDYTKMINGRQYVGPHKWIVCLLGDNCYAVNKFRLNHKEKLLRQQNMSISMMTLS